MIKFILNDKIGLPALIRHIKYGMNLITYQRRTNMRSRSNMPDRFISHAGNIHQENMFVK